MYYPPSGQKRRREIHAAAALKRQEEQNLSRSDDQVFRDMVDILKAIHQNEIDLIDKGRADDADETEEAICDTAASELAQVDMGGIEVTLAAPDPSTAADTSSPFTERVHQ